MKSQKHTSYQKTWESIWESEKSLVQNMKELCRWYAYAWGGPHSHNHRDMMRHIAHSYYRTDSILKEIANIKKNPDGTLDALEAFLQEKVNHATAPLETNISPI